ncbi:NAD(P)/FAD-dependent oxidoreductase [Natrarchaeobius chitinivorans]|uniref:FAD-binding oxidoreductase n=1 Tax=Natrarchaeobius chitinivorans TaxID=1679083 RepID=A0A3N6LXC7_NATCH|nr:FAD-binding oxidoreductase [Natrarchaeobius chitinivorans]RQG95413.1 FAD-binding oxidoreductase [Natrarchaeobius chitinivorans]
MSVNEYELIVIGGGIIGASCGWHWVNATNADVLILEKDQPASKATGRSAGHLNTYASHKFPSAIREYCIEFYQELSCRHDEITIHHDQDYVLAHSSEGADRLHRLTEAHPDTFTYLDSDNLQTTDVPFNTVETTAALTFDRALHSDPYSLTTAMLSEFRSAGGTLKLDSVTDINTDGDRFLVNTTDGTYRSEYLVNATGAWSTQTNSMLDISLPIKARTSQIAILKPDRQLDIPMFHCPDLGLYGRQELGDDVLIGGGTSSFIPDPNGFSTTVSESFLVHVSESSDRIANSLRDARVAESWAGRCTSTPDRNPLVGSTSLSDYYICAGFNGAGVARAPFAGKLVTELILDQDLSFQPEPYAPSRFNEADDFKVKSHSTDW